MIDERFFVLDDGTELVLMESVKIDEVRYLLLSANDSDDVVIAYEDDGKLIFVDENSDSFSTIVKALFRKFNDKLV